MNIAPMDPAAITHYLAAMAVAKLSPANVSSTFRSACDARELVAEVSKRSIPDAAAYLRNRFPLKVGNFGTRRMP